MFDLIPLIPFNKFITGEHTRFFYLLKWIRIVKANVILDPDRFFKQVKEWVYDKRFTAVLNDDELKDDTHNDHNKIKK